MSGMSFMIKKLLVILLLSSCGNLPIAYIQNFSSVNNVVFGFPDLDITEEIYNDYDYSFIKVRFARGPVSILILAFVEENTYQWVGADNVSIFTENGRVIKTTGLDHNLDISSKSKVTGQDIVIQEKINLTNPDLYSALLTSYMASRPETFLKFGKKVDALKISENISIKLIGWKRSNYYFKNLETGLVEKSKQHIHPRLPALNIEFYYKF